MIGSGSPSLSSPSPDPPPPVPSSTSHSLNGNSCAASFADRIFLRSFPSRLMPFGMPVLVTMLGGLKMMLTGSRLEG
eukprot:6450047-Pyramimonas_sp.AAC.1